jgi:membrane protein
MALRRGPTILGPQEIFCKSNAVARQLQSYGGWKEIVMSLKTLTELVKQTFREWSDDKVPRMGAAIAYYSVFSLAPLILTAIGIASIVFGREAAQGAVAQELEGMIGPTAAQAIEDLLKQTNQSGQGHTAALLGIAVLLFGASGVFIELQDALNTIWKVDRQTRFPWWHIVTVRLLSLSVVLGTGFLLLISLILSAALKRLSDILAPSTLPAGYSFWQTLNQLVSFLLITLLLALIYKLLPDAKIAWRDIWLGAFITAFLFTLGKYLIGLYLGQSTTDSGLKAGGSLVVLLVWVYYSSQIVLFGAEFTHVYAEYRRSQANQRPTLATVA